jgi:hypothetical protein
MNTDLIDPTILDMIDPETLEVRDLEAQAPARPAAVPLAEVLYLIRRDSRREPRQYLDETIVPHGGE